MTCNPLCRCVSCENTPDNSVVRTEAIKIILERNPNAFDSKFKPVHATGITAPVPTISTTVVASHKNGCRCRKSFCLKKYCECFQASVTCSAICTCLSCCNTGSSSVKLLASVSTVNQMSSSNQIKTGTSVMYVCSISPIFLLLILLIIVLWAVVRVERSQGICNMWLLRARVAR